MRLTGLLVVGLVILHFLVHVGLGVGPAAPDLLTLGLLLGARELRMGSAGVLGFVLGLLEDSFSVLAFGANTLAMTLVGILGSRSRDLFVGDSLLFFLAYLGLGKLLKDLVHWLATGDTLRGPFATEVLLQGGLGALYVAALGLVLLVLLGERRDLP